MESKNYFDKNGRLYMKEYLLNNTLKRLDIFYPNGYIKFSTFYENRNIRELFQGEGIVKYHNNGMVDKKLYYLNGELSSMNIYENNLFKETVRYEPRNKFFR